MTRRRLLPLLFILGAVLTAIGAAAVISQRQIRLRGALNGIPDINLPERVPVLGVNTALHTYDNAQLAENLDLIAEAGFVWVRQPFHWQSAGWDEADRLIGAVHERDLRMVAVLHGESPPTDVGTFADYAAEFAERYAAEVEVYQIWDEPNLASGWDGQSADPVAYAVMLEAAYNAIHDHDPQALVLTAGFAPTVERGPANVAEPLFLRALYENGAGPFFDGVAAKPYGFDTGPGDRRTNLSTLNASRFVLLREEMVRWGDEDKPLWATQFGWNTLPDGWQGAPSVWGQTTETLRTERTLALYDRALTEWPWSGAFILENWQPDAPPEDPRWGFALRDQQGDLAPLVEALSERSTAYNTALWPGIYPAAAPLATYTGEWEFSELGADFSEAEESVVEVPFRGGSLAVITRRDDYRAYLYVTVDGEPARGLPQEYIDNDDVGNNGAYVVLTSPDYTPRIEALPVAQGYDAGATHTARIEAERGWDQWALVGFAVGNTPPTLSYDLLAGGLLLAAVAFTAGAVWRAGELGWLREAWQFAVKRLDDPLHTVLTLASALAVYAGIALTLGGALPEAIRDRADAAPLIFTAITAGFFYFSPVLLVTLLALVLLFMLLYTKPKIGPGLMVAFAPFYLVPRPLFDRSFSMVEVISLLMLAVWVLREVATWQEDGPPRLARIWARMTPLDKAVGAFVALAVVSLLWVDLLGVAVTELRVMVLEPAVVYLVLRTYSYTEEERYRILDLLVASVVIVAVAGFVQFGQEVITTRDFVCLRSVTGTCNNAALLMGRVIPIALAVVLIGGDRTRRWLYGAAGGLLLLAALLTTSRGGLLLGIPAGVGLVVILWGGRRAAFAVGAAVALQFLALIPLGRLVPRFNLFSQSNLFRVQLWQSTLRMLRDHPITGLGLDQFLYAYRGQYILPAAWQQPDLSQPHNLLLNYWVRLGILGVVIGVWLQIIFWRMAFRTQKRLRWFAQPSQRALVVGLMGSMAAFLAHGMVDATHFVIDLAFIFFMTLGLMHQLHEEVVDGS